MRTVAFEKPYLIVFHTQDKWQHGWFTGPDAAQFIKLRSNPKRIQIDHDGKQVLKDDGDVVRLDADLLPAAIYKIGVVGQYDTLAEIYRSYQVYTDPIEIDRSQPMLDFLLGGSINDLLWEIQW